MFNDRKEVCFVTNVFPESMNSKVYNIIDFSTVDFLENNLSPHPYQSITSICVLLMSLARLEKHMGLIMIESQGVSGLECFTRVRISPLTIHMHILYKHNCKESLIKSKAYDQHAFRLELAHLLFAGRY